MHREEVIRVIQRHGLCDRYWAQVEHDRCQDEFKQCHEQVCGHSKVIALILHQTTPAHIDNANLKSRHIESMIETKCPDKSDQEMIKSCPIYFKRKNMLMMGTMELLVYTWMYPVELGWEHIFLQRTSSFFRISHDQESRNLVKKVINFIDRP